LPALLLPPLPALLLPPLDAVPPVLSPASPASPAELTFLASSDPQPTATSQDALKIPMTPRRRDKAMWKLLSALS
jgi:hypothetical protein